MDALTLTFSHLSAALANATREPSIGDVIPHHAPLLKRLIGATRTMPVSQARQRFAVAISREGDDPHRLLLLQLVAGALE